VGVVHGRRLPINLFNSVDGKATDVLPAFYLLEHCFISKAAFLYKQSVKRQTTFSASHDARTRFQALSRCRVREEAPAIVNKSWTKPKKPDEKAKLEGRSKFCSVTSSQNG